MSEVALAITLLVIASGNVLWRYGAHRRQWRDALEAIALDYGLYLAPESLLSWACLQGKNQELELNLFMSGGVPHVKLRGNIHPRLSLKREGGLTSLTKLVTGQDIQTGSPFFDNQLLIHGPEDYALAVLDSSTRELVLIAIGLGVTVQSGEIIWIGEEMKRELPPIEKIVEVVTKLGAALSLDAGSVAEKLAHNAQMDPDERCRRRYFKALVEHHPKAKITQETARLFCAHPDPALRLKAAASVGEDGLKVLEDIFHTPLAPEGVRAEAWTLWVKFKRRLDQNSPQELRPQEKHQNEEQYAIGRVPEPLRLEMEDQLERYFTAKGPRSPEVLAAVFESIALCRLNVGYERLAPAMNHGSPQVREYFAWAIHHLNDVRVEPALIKLLADPKDNVVIRSVRLLGRIGSKNAVKPLLDLTKKRRISKKVTNAAQDALTTIKLGLNPQTQGALSLSAVENGAISLAQPSDLDGHAEQD